MDRFEDEDGDSVEQKHDVDLLLYLKNRAEPCHVQACFEVPTGALEKDDDDERVEEFMAIMESAILEVLDTQGEHRYVFTDSRHNKRVVLISELQMISILAPDQTTLALMAAS